MTYIFDATTDNRWYLHWNGEFVGFYQSRSLAFAGMKEHMQALEAA